MKTDPDAAGFDARRLARIDEHLDRAYVTPQKIAGCQVAVLRHGVLAHHSSLGSMDLERGRGVEDDTIWRLYSMTKPITGVALLTLYERGRFQLSDPVHRFLPEWRDVQVKERLADGTRHLVAPARPMEIRDVMMHMAGIGYGPQGARLDLGSLGSSTPAIGKGLTLETLSETLATEPLRSHPGTQWLYSWSTDICARLVEAISGERFDEYLQHAIFDPLGMVDTGFHVPEASASRLAALYTRDEHKRLKLLDDPERSRSLRPATFLSGGGLLGTTADYLRFCSMLAGGGEVDGVRILSRPTVDLMRTNHLPGGRELREFTVPGGYGEVGFDGTGFGLTVAVGLGPARTAGVGPAGDYMWGGAASTLFWIDPTEDLVVVFMTQLIPSGTFGFRPQLRSIVYGAVAD